MINLRAPVIFDQIKQPNTEDISFFKNKLPLDAMNITIDIHVIETLSLSDFIFISKKEEFSSIISKSWIIFFTGNNTSMEMTRCI